MGLKSFDAIYVLPVFQVRTKCAVSVLYLTCASAQGFFIGGSVVGGGVYFREFDSFSGTRDCGGLQLADFLETRELGLFMYTVAREAPLTRLAQSPSGSCSPSGSL